MCKHFVNVKMTIKDAACLSTGLIIYFSYGVQHSVQKQRLQNSHSQGNDQVIASTKLWLWRRYEWVTVCTWRNYFMLLYEHLASEHKATKVVLLQKKKERKENRKKRGESFICFVWYVYEIKLFEHLSLASLYVHRKHILHNTQLQSMSKPF